MKKQTRLPHTSRVNDKIMEYYMKFGQERDLEKFMRLYSPAASQRSKSRTTTTTTTTTTDSSSCCASACSDIDAGALRVLYEQKESNVPTISTRSLPNMVLPQTDVHDKHSRSDIIIIPIGQIEEQAAENDFRTPKKLQNFEENTEIRTPDSVAKVHKRLEWDSLADVGYPKSKSTSNISTIERSLLRELFQENTSGMLQTNASESDLKKLQSDQQSSALLKKPEYNTPPLASSTLVDRPVSKRDAAQHVAAIAKCNKPASKSTVSRNNIVAKQKLMLSGQHGASHIQQTEKFSQTANAVFKTQSQEVQVNMSSMSSAIGSSIAASSFDDYESHKNADSTNEDGDLLLSCKRSHPFIVGISDMLAQRRAIAEREKQFTDRSAQCQIEVESLQKIHDTFRHVLDENKENTKSTERSSCSVRTSPELELGIQLLCSLIEAKSLNQKQKHKLVREIVKRILVLNSESSSSTMFHGTPSASNFSDNAKKQNSCTSELDNISRLVLEGIETGRSTKERVTDKVSLGQAASGVVKQNRDTPEALAPLPPLPAVKTLKTSKIRKPNNTASTKKITEERSIGTNTQFSLPISTASRTRQTTTAVSNSTSSSAKYPTTSNSSTSHTSERITQKPAVEPCGDHTDVDQTEHGTMREWLNPMTQSEIEYEDKKRELAASAAKLEKAQRKLRKYADRKEPERLNQINWLDNEIKRLESLRALLVTEDSQLSSSSMYVSPNANTKTTSISVAKGDSVDKLYDTVHTSTTKSSLLSESAERQAAEIAAIIEESNEDNSNSAEQLPYSRQNYREAQLLPSKRLDDDYVSPKKQHCFRTINEQATSNEEKLLKNGYKQKKTAPKENYKDPTPPPLPPRTQQRSKIDTPSVDSIGTESVGSFVQQRKSEFIEQYKIKKKSHYEALLRQQQQETRNIEQQKEKLQQQQQRRKNNVTATNTNYHYTLPTTTRRTTCHVCSQHAFHPHFCTHCHHMPYTYPLTTLLPPPASQTQTKKLSKKSRSTQVSLDSQTQIGQPSNSTTNSSTSYLKFPTPKIKQDHSSGSLFCTTSTDVSIPMGTTNTTSTSTTTTTHQYDVVAATATATATAATSKTAIGVQTDYDCDFSSRMELQYENKYNYKPTSQTACIQVKPKGIAYVIQFDRSTDSVNAKMSQARKQNTKLQEIECKEKAAIAQELTLQEHLRLAKPQFVEHSKARKALLNQLQSLRQAREREMRQIVENSSFNSMERHLDERLPPPAASRVRLFPVRQLKAMTKRSVANLPEVLAKQQREKEEHHRRGNRMLRDIFNRRLQRRVHKGKLSLNHCLSVI